MQSVHITTNVVSSNPAQAIQHYVIKFVSDLRQVGGFLRALRNIELRERLGSMGHRPPINKYGEFNRDDKFSLL